MDTGIRQRYRFAEVGNLDAGQLFVAAQDIDDFDRPCRLGIHLREASTATAMTAPMPALIAMRLPDESDFSGLASFMSVCPFAG